MHRALPLIAMLLLPLAGCAVKPALRYVSPEGELYEAGITPPRRGERAPPRGDSASAALPAGAAEGLDAPAPSTPGDPVQAHFTTALGLQASCRYGEALATYRGVIEADPDGVYAARAMVRMAEILLEPGYHGADPERARELLREVEARFPGSAAGRVAGEMLCWQ